MDKTDEQKKWESRLIQFAVQTLCLMDGSPDWGADMWGTVACLAHVLGLSSEDEQGQFRVTVVDPSELVLRAGMLMEPQDADLYDRVLLCTRAGTRLSLLQRAHIKDVQSALRLLRLGLLVEHIPPGSTFTIKEQS